MPNGELGGEVVNPGARRRVAKQRSHPLSCEVATRVEVTYFKWSLGNGKDVAEAGLTRGEEKW